MQFNYVQFYASWNGLIKSAACKATDRGHRKLCAILYRSLKQHRPSAELLGLAKEPTALGRLQSQSARVRRAAIHSHNRRVSRAAGLETTPPPPPTRSPRYADLSQPPLLRQNWLHTLRGRRRRRPSTTSGRPHPCA